MADISKIQIGVDSTIYNIKDATARQRLDAILASKTGKPAELGTATNGISETAARSDHVHNKPTYGNITASGAITANASISSGDRIVIVDSSNSSKLTGASITFDGSTETKFLSQKGAWLVPASVPRGGTTGQVLIKKSNSDYDADWYSMGSFPANPKWYLPTGVSESSVVAAYKFVGASSEAAALLPVSGNTRNVLSKVNDPTWAASTGFYFPPSAYLKTETSSFETEEIAEEGGETWIVPISVDFKSVVFGYRYAEVTSSQKGGIGIAHDDKIILSEHKEMQSCIILNHTNNYWYKSALKKEQGVLGGNWIADNNYKIFYNGMPLSLTKSTNKTVVSNHYTNMVIGFNSNLGNNCIPAYVTAIVFYNIQLSAAQHMELYENIKALGGGID